jgi:hypothetical protein
VTFSLGGDVVDLAETPYGGPSDGVGVGAATLVRMVLVPGVMELLGKANWWPPGPLARVLPKTSPPEDEPLAADLALTRSAG